MVYSVCHPTSHNERTVCCITCARPSSRPSPQSHSASSAAPHGQGPSSAHHPPATRPTVVSRRSRSAARPPTSAASSPPCGLPAPPPGSRAVARAHAAAINLTTGALLPWNPAPNGTVQTIAVDGSTVILGGSFTRLGARNAGRLVAVTATDRGGALESQAQRAGQRRGDSRRGRLCRRGVHCRGKRASRLPGVGERAHRSAPVRLERDRRRPGNGAGAHPGRIDHHRWRNVRLARRGRRAPTGLGQSD